MKSTFVCVITPIVLMAGALCSAAPPNVVMIIGDDQAWTDFGFMGHEVIRTPHLDKLAAESATFPHGYVPTSLCRASLATLLTGLYAHQHKICCNDPPDGVAREAMHPFIQNSPALPRLLAKHGYRSFQTGKFWEGHHSNAGFTDGMTVKGRHGDDGLKIGRQGIQPVKDFIEEAPDKPFMLWYAPMLPHEPHNPPDRLLKKYSSPDRHPKLARYYAMCEWFDETCGELLAYLDEKGLRENTLVVFAVDNGWIQETAEKRTTRGWFAPKSKMSPYDGGIRTPILLRLPGKIKPTKHEELVSTIDLVPTILSACGIKPPEEMPGLNLMDFASDGGKLNRDAIFGEIYVHTCIDINKPAVNLTHRWIRTGPWKLILAEEEGQGPELFNVSADPFEEKNLAESKPKQVSELTQRIDQWWTAE